MSNIVINATATTSGGALTVLIQFLEAIKTYDNQNTYFVFSNAAEVLKYQGHNIRIVNHIYRHKWLGRIWWDNYGIERWLAKNGIEPNLIVSLQNTGIRLGRKVKQLIYYHQSIPMYDYHWSFFKKEERLLWMYKHIYPYFVKKNFYENDTLVVQSDWMLQQSMKVLALNRNQIQVVKPTIQFDWIDIEAQKKTNEDDTFTLLYPATAMAFKNHKIIFEALKYIKRQDNELFNRIKVILTVTKEEFLLSEYEEVKERIEFLGNLPFDLLIEKYKQSDALIFPSYLETVGLPLLEAAHFGLPVIVADLPYAREALAGYEGVFFANYRSAERWADQIIILCRNRTLYEPYAADEAEPWQDMFNMIKQQLGEKKQ